MDSFNDGDIQSMHTMISNDTLIKMLDKEELCTSLSNTKLSCEESSYIFQKIKSKYEIVDRLDIIHHLSIDFGEISNIEITKILELLRIFGKCIEFEAFDSIVEIVESIFSRNKQQQKYNKNIEALKSACNYNFDLLYDIFNKIAYENDAEAMSFVINEKLHETKNKNNQNIFCYSLEQSNCNLIRFMTEFGINYTQHQFTMRQNIFPKYAKYFSKFPDFDVNAKDEYNKTALIYASEEGYHEVVKLLLTFPGIDVNAKDCGNNTALICASFKGYHEVVKLLLTVPGIDVNAKDKDNSTALIWASFKGYHEVVKHLLTVPGIDVNAKDEFNNTALIWASKNGHHEVVKLLITAPGIDVNPKYVRITK